MDTKTRNKLLKMAKELVELQNEKLNMAISRIGEIQDEKLKKFLSDSMEKAKANELTPEEFAKNLKNITNAN